MPFIPVRKAQSDAGTLVPQASSRAPVVPAAYGDGGAGLNVLGQGLQQASQKLDAFAQKVQTREDTVARAGAMAQYQEAAQKEMMRLSTEADWGDVKTFDSYGSYLSSVESKLMEAHGGSADSRAMLQARIVETRTAMVQRAAGLNMQAGQARVMGMLDTKLGAITAAASQAPGKMTEHFIALDRDIDEMAPALTPEQETALRASGRSQIVLSSVNALVDRPGGTAAASALIVDHPEVIAMLPPDQQRILHSKIAAAEAEQSRASREANDILNRTRTLLGREPTMSERVRLAGLGGGDMSPADKLARIEEAVGPLTREQKMRALGVSPDGAQTPAGKTVQDRQMFISQFGADSPQVKAFDEMTADARDPGVNDVGGIRREFTGQSVEFTKVKSAYERIQTAAQSPSAAGDIVLIYGFMKLNDPNVGLTEGDYANAQNTAGISEKVWGLYNRLLEGERLSPEQRADFLGQAQNLYSSRLGQQRQLEQQYRGIAARAGMRPEDVVIDFVGRDDPAVQGSAGHKAQPSGGGVQPSGPSSGQPRIKLDLNGGVVADAPNQGGEGS